MSDRSNDTGMGLTGFLIVLIVFTNGVIFGSMVGFSAVLPLAGLCGGVLVGVCALAIAANRTGGDQ